MFKLPFRWQKLEDIENLAISVLEHHYLRRERFFHSPTLRHLTASCSAGLNPCAQTQTPTRIVRFLWQSLWAPRQSSLFRHECRPVDHERNVCLGLLLWNYLYYGQFLFLKKLLKSSTVERNDKFFAVAIPIVPISIFLLLPPVHTTVRIPVCTT